MVEQRTLKKVNGAEAVKPADTRWSQVRYLPAAPLPLVARVSLLPNIRIDEFHLSDYDLIVNLWKEAGLVLRPGDDMDSVRLKLQRDPDLFLVAREMDEVVGSVMGGWDGRRGWIYHLAVRPSHQRQGIAKALIRELEFRLAEKGAKRVNAQIYESNTASIRFFGSCGYEIRPDLVMIGKALND